MGSDETATATTGGPRVIDVFDGNGAPYPPLPCHAARHGSTCETDADGSWWPEQARVPRAMRAAMGETELDAAVAAFVADVDTEAIHGAPMVPGHGRWYPRSYRSTYAP